MIDPPISLRIRPMEPGDRNFILSSWLRSYIGKNVAQGKDGYADVRAYFYEDYAPVIRDLVERSTILVACLEDEPSSIVAWLAAEGDDIIHYVLVKPRWRRLGVAKWLLQDLASVRAHFTHVTADARKCQIPEAWTYRRWKIWKENGQ